MSTTGLETEIDRNYEYFFLCDSSLYAYTEPIKHRGSKLATHHQYHGVLKDAKKIC